MFFLLLAVMLVGSYLAGSIPLIVRFSEEKLKLATVLGKLLLESWLKVKVCIIVTLFDTTLKQHFSDTRMRW